MYRETEQPPQPDRSLLIVGIRGHVYAIDRDSGQLRWHNELPGGGLEEVALAVGYGVVVASARGRRLFCLDYLTGQTRWEAATQSGGRATILIEPDQIVCAKAGYLDCFAPDGTQKWSQPLRGAGTGRAALGYPGNVVQADDIGNQ